MNDGDMVPKDNLPIPPETAAEGGIWKKVGDWDTGYQKDDILYIKKLDNKLKFQYYSKFDTLFRIDTILQRTLPRHLHSERNASREWPERPCHPTKGHRR